jgi:phytoene dehydrogenase-like protein
MKSVDAVIVGGGLSGLTAAIYLRRQGKSVLLFEKAKQLGGRAISQEQHGFRMNLGPHALYKGGAAFKILQELQIPFSGKAPGRRGTHILNHGKVLNFPRGPFSLLTSRYFNSMSARLEAGRILSSLPEIQTDRLMEMPLVSWMQQHICHPEVRAFLSAIVRVTTYTNDPQRMSAGAAIRQIQLGVAGNVLYLDNGWQTLVDGLKEVASQAGIEIVSNARVIAIEQDGFVRGVRLANGVEIESPRVILAIGPEEASNLVPTNKALRRYADEAIPVRMACLTIGLRRLPVPKHRFLLGIDQPLYLSVHSAYAQFSQDRSQALIHLGKYLPSDSDSSPEQDRKELENMLDLFQPRWRHDVIVESFLPRMIVSNAILRCLERRPSPEVPAVAGLYLAGDWVGTEGMLADAALASAKQAALCSAGILPAEVKFKSLLEAGVTNG